MKTKQNIRNERVPNSDTMSPLILTYTPNTILGSYGQDSPTSHSHLSENCLTYLNFIFFFISKFPKINYSKVALVGK